MTGITFLDYLLFIDQIEKRKSEMITYVDPIKIKEKTINKSIDNNVGEKGAVPAQLAQTSVSTNQAISGINSYGAPKKEEQEIPENKLQKFSPPRLKTIERYKYRDVSDAITYSYTTFTGRFTHSIIVYTFTPISSYSDDLERLILYTEYDNYHDIWNIYSILKKKSYSCDTEQDRTPERTAFSVEELISEVKKILLFFSVSPKVAFDLFARTLNGQLINKDGIWKSINALPYEIKITKKSYYSSSNSGSYSSGWQGSYHDHHKDKDVDEQRYEDYWGRFREYE